jgi:hypothetical protein
MCVGNRDSSMKSSQRLIVLAALGEPGHLQSVSVPLRRSEGVRCLQRRRMPGPPWFQSSAYLLDWRHGSGIIDRSKPIAGASADRDW